MSLFIYDIYIYIYLYMSSTLDKTSIRQLQVAVPLRLNIAKRVT